MTRNTIDVLDIFLLECHSNFAETSCMVYKPLSPLAPQFIFTTFTRLPDVGPARETRILLSVYCFLSFGCCAASVALRPDRWEAASVWELVLRFSGHNFQSAVQF